MYAPSSGTELLRLFSIPMKRTEKRQNARRGDATRQCSGCKHMKGVIMTNMSMCLEPGNKLAGMENTYKSRIIKWEWSFGPNDFSDWLGTMHQIIILIF